MKLLTYLFANEIRLGAFLGDWVVDIKAAHDVYQRQATARPFSSKLGDMRTLLEAGESSLAAIRDLLSWVNSGGQAVKGETMIPRNQVELLPPVLNPSKIVCVGLNYADHCREQNLEIPKSPIFFAKFPTALIGDRAAVTWPPDLSSQVDYEAELAVVIGRRAKTVPVEEAMEYVAGYTIINDISARDVQFADKQWIRGKSFDTFCPIGPSMVTADEIQDPHRLGIRCWVNGQLLQNSNTDQLIFKIPELIAFLSKSCTLLPGDVISTGTPDGVGVFRDPQVFLRPGDVVEVEIEKLGKLRNPVV